MLNPLQITFHDIDKSEEIEALIAEKYAKIFNENPNVTKCHVVVEKLSKHHQKGNMACVRMDLKIPRFDDIVVKEGCTVDKKAIKNAIIAVFKEAIDLVRENKKHRQQQSRVSTKDLPIIEPAESEAEAEA